MVSGGSGACRSRSRREAMPNPVSLTSPVVVHQDMRRLEVLVDQAALVRLTQSGGDAHGEAQEASELEGRAQQPAERLAARILEHQYGSAAVTPQLQRPDRPGTVQLIFQAIFVREPVESGRSRVLRGEQHRQDVPLAIDPPAEHAVAVLP
jgi:hypothetical protein